MEGLSSMVKVPGKKFCFAKSLLTISWEMFQPKDLQAKAIMAEKDSHINLILISIIAIPPNTTRNAQSTAINIITAMTFLIISIPH
jgi:hypothetical protein